MLQGAGLPPGEQSAIATAGGCARGQDAYARRMCTDRGRRRFYAAGWLISAAEGGSRNTDPSRQVIVRRRLVAAPGNTPVQFRVSYVPAELAEAIREFTSSTAIQR